MAINNYIVASYWPAIRWSFCVPIWKHFRKRRVPGAENIGLHPESCQKRFKKIVARMAALKKKMPNYIHFLLSLL
ncbi:hypothetical protein FKM82_024825 [Ascaphus truei]